MADERLPQKLNIPKLRVASQSFNDSNNFALANSSNRTVSSSTSLLSTPSNNIRKVQQMNPQARSRAPAKSKSKASDVKIAGVSSTAAATKKLLNLQKSKKSYTRSRPFVLRKPENMSMYDYSVFSKRLSNDYIEDEDSKWRPLVKNSQIKAWESAEKITSNIIFDNDQKSDMEIFEDGPESSDSSMCDDTNEKGADSSSHKSRVLRSLPHYTKGELNVLLDKFDELRTTKQRIDYNKFEETEKKALWIYRQQQSVSQERAFNANHTLQGKKKVQVFHKKELLHKLFGYSNSLNQEHITNNSSYSAYDNVFNAQKAFHEDKDEIVGLLEEDAAFESDLEAVRQRHLSKSKSGESSENAPPNSNGLGPENSDLADLTHSWLTSSYEKELSAENSDALGVEHEDLNEMMACTISHLKQCVKDACDNDDA